MGARRSLWLTAWLALGLVFLYLPIVLLVASSFSDSRLMTELGRPSFRWYVALWRNRALIDAAGLSLVIATVSATGAMVLGGLCGFVLARLRPFRGWRVFAGLVAVPLVLPDLVLALALLLLFVAAEQVTGWPAGRGVTTVVLAHVTASLGYVAVVVEGRLANAGRAFEEAAADLGAAPLVAFRRVTLPRIAPALAAGWLLAFTLSLDDVVIASFNSGPGATTLPMVIFSALRLGPTPVLNALATVILVVTAGVLGVAWRLRRAGSGPAQGAVRPFAGSR